MRLDLLLALVVASSALDDAADRVARAFKPRKDPSVAQARRSEALDGLGDRVGADTVAALVRAGVTLEKEIAAQEEARLRYLARGVRNKSLEDRFGLDPLKELLDRVTARLVATEHPAALDAAVRAALEEPRLPMTLRVAVARRAGRSGDEALASVTAVLDRPRKPDALLPALVAAEALGPDAAGLTEAIVARLHDGSAAVRESAAAALGALADPAAIRPLVDAVAREQGRTRARVGRALERLTGVKNGASAAAWRAWLEDDAGPYLDGERPLGEGAPSDTAIEGGAEADYYGIPIDGEAVVFVLDRSNSMKQPLAKKTVEGNEGEKSKAVTAPAGERRMDRARAELKRTLSKLRPHQRFNVVAFGATNLIFSDELVRARPREIARAQAWVDAIPFQFGTNLYDALQQTFAMAGRGARDEAYDAAVDTIFLLTDGQPVVKTRYDKKPRIRAETLRWNLLGRVVIHVIGLGEPLPKKFLRGLAEENGGRFVHERARA